jgi:drug/metabolite transporter (DMT)-like permease
MKLHPHQKALIMIVICNILWSSAGVLIKGVQWNPMAINGVRSGIAAVVIWLWLGKVDFHLSFAQIGAAIGYVIASVGFVLATQMTTAANAVFLLHSAPFLTAFLGWTFLREKLEPLDFILLAVATVGIALFFVDRLSMNGLWGNLWALLAGVGYSIITICLRMQKEGSPNESIILGGILCFIIGLPFMWHNSPGGWGWSALIALGIFQLGLTGILFPLALKNIKAFESQFLGMLESVLNPVWVFLFIGETPKFWSMIGAGIVLAATAIKGYATATREAH